MTKENFIERMKELLIDAGIEYVSGDKLSADSIQYISLVSAVEEEFNILLPDEFLNYSLIQNVDVFLDAIYELLH